MDLLQDHVVDKYYLIIDALDECDVGSMEKFLRLLAHEIPKLSKVKWIVTTRNEQRIMEHFQDRQNGCNIDLEMNTMNVARAVQSFVDLKVHELKTRKRYDDELSTYVRRHLQENAAGTFLWVSLVCKELEKCWARKAREVCGRFPMGLVPLYQQMLERIEQNNDAEELKQLLRILTVACRSLHLGELGIIAGLSELTIKGHDWQNARDLVASCGSFLMVREERVEFVHKSAKDYFNEGAGSRIFPTGQSALHNALSSHLLQIMSESLRRNICDIRDEGTTAEHVDKDVLCRNLPSHLRYACCFWAEHVQRSESPPQDNDDVHKFLHKNFLYWLEALSLIKRIDDAISMLANLQKLLKVCITYFSYCDMTSNKFLIGESPQSRGFFSFGNGRGRLAICSMLPANN